MKTPRILQSLGLFLACIFLLGINIRAQNQAPQDSDTIIYNLKEVDRPPVTIGLRAAPTYPFELKRDGIEASCMMEFVVNEQGVTEQVKALETTNKLWTIACIGAVKKWKFRPAMKNGVPVKCRMQLPIEGTLIEGKVTPSALTVLTPKKVDKPPRVTRLSIKYPDALRKGQKTGSVTVQYTITVKGTLEDLKITKSKHEDFGKAVTDALASAKYTPGILNGAPVDCRVQQTVRFDIVGR